MFKSSSDILLASGDPCGRAFFFALLFMPLQPWRGQERMGNVKNKLVGTKKETTPLLFEKRKCTAWKLSYFYAHSTRTPFSFFFRRCQSAVVITYQRGDVVSSVTVRLESLEEVMDGIFVFYKMSLLCTGKAPLEYGEGWTGWGYCLSGRVWWNRSYFTEKQRFQFAIKGHPSDWKSPPALSGPCDVQRFRDQVTSEFRWLRLLWPELTSAWLKLIEMEISLVEKKTDTLERIYGMHANDPPSYSAVRLDTPADILCLNHLLFLDL